MYTYMYNMHILCKCTARYMLLFKYVGCSLLTWLIVFAEFVYTVHYCAFKVLNF